MPYAAGGGGDVIARIVAERVSAGLGQPIVIEIRGGAGGTIATRQVAKAVPDGYTLLIATSSLAINPSLYPNAGYDPRTDFAPVGLIASSSNVVAGGSVGTRHKGIDRRIDRAGKARGGEARRSRWTGTGSSVHLGAELFAGMAGYEDHAHPVQGLRARADRPRFGGHVAMMFSTLPSAAGSGEGRQQGARTCGDRAEAIADLSRSADRR